MLLIHIYVADPDHPRNKEILGKGKPEIVKLYNEWYGGVDHMDHYLYLIRP
jgi:hypothetical protein